MCLIAGAIINFGTCSFTKCPPLADCRLSPWEDYNTAFSPLLESEVLQMSDRNLVGSPLACYVVQNGAVAFLHKEVCDESKGYLLVEASINHGYDIYGNSGIPSIHLCDQTLQRPSQCIMFSTTFSRFVLSRFGQVKDSQFISTGINQMST